MCRVAEHDDMAANIQTKAHITPSPLHHGQKVDNSGMRFNGRESPRRGRCGGRRISLWSGLKNATGRGQERAHRRGLKSRGQWIVKEGLTYRVEIQRSFAKHEKITDFDSTCA
jgi:hypothetical protein